LLSVAPLPRGVETRVLVRAVKCKLTRLLAVFMVQLTLKELAALSSPSFNSNAGRGGRRAASFAFTKEGIAMPASVLGGQRAIAINIVRDEQLTERSRQVL
jgi:hypothetical protein